MVGLTDVDIPIILWISGGVTNKYLTIYLKLNVDEHKPENDEEEVVKSEPHPGRVEGAGVWDPEGGDHQSCCRVRGCRMRRPASRQGRLNLDMAGSVLRSTFDTQIEKIDKKKKRLV